MLKKMALGTVAAALVAHVLYFFLMKRDEEKEPVILGQQMADAMDQEKRRLKETPGSRSPIPAEAYRRRKGEWGLLNPQPVALDGRLRKLCGDFAAMAESEREAFRGAVSFEENYTLLDFARRSSVFALRNEDPAIIRDGLTAIAMIEEKRTDFRDVLVALSLLHYSAGRLDMDTKAAFEEGATFAESGTAKLIRGFAERDARGQNLRDSWGYLEVGSSDGIGFVNWGFRRYKPETDLLPLAKRISSVIEKDHYRVSSIEIGDEFPPFWLESPEDQSAVAILKKASGAASITGDLEEDKGPEPGSQMFTVFLAELDSAESASRLLELSKEKPAKDFCRMGFTSGKVFGLLVARSVFVGTDSYETSETLERFRAPLDAAFDSIRESG